MLVVDGGGGGGGEIWGLYGGGAGREKYSLNRNKKNELLTLLEAGICKKETWLGAKDWHRGVADNQFVRVENSLTHKGFYFSSSKVCKTLQLLNHTYTRNTN